MVTHTCEYLFGAEYCESPIAESAKVILVGVAVLAAIIAFASAIGSGSLLSGTELIDPAEFFIP